MIVGIDCDEVLRDFTGSLKRVYAKHYPDHQVLPIREWDLAPCFPIGKEIYSFFNEEHPHDVFGNADILPGASEMVKQIKAMGHTIVIATSQAPGTEWITLEWLEKHGIKYDSILFGRDKSILKADILLDDGVHNLQVFTGLPVAFSRPWNHSWNGFRVATHQEFTDYIKRMRRETANA